MAKSKKIRNYILMFLGIISIYLMTCLFSYKNNLNKFKEYIY